MSPLPSQESVGKQYLSDLAESDLTLLQVNLTPGEVLPSEEKGYIYQSD